MSTTKGKFLKPELFFEIGAMVGFNQLFDVSPLQVTLDTIIPVKMPFTRASAIFHHWVVDGLKLGLAFNGTADARSFDRGIRVALENLDKSKNLQLEEMLMRGMALGKF